MTVQARPLFIPFLEPSVTPASITSSGYLYPAQIATAYDIPASTGAGVKVGIISLGGGWLQSDLNLAMSDLSLTSPSITTVLVDGATNNFSSNISSLDGAASIENILDLVCVAGMVPAANIVLYIGKNTGVYYDNIDPKAISTRNLNTSFGNLINRAVDENCDVITISWANGEKKQTAGISYYIGDYLKEPLARARAKGISVLAASGDYGSQPTSSNHVVSVVYPASSANVIAVGGTNLAVFSGNSVRSSEYASTHSGGGLSSMIDLPIWQQNLTYTPYFKANATPGTPTPLTIRGVPDISAPMNGYGMYFNGAFFPVGGTSAATPILAGMIARYISIYGRRPPELNPLFYRNINSFSDLTVGNNAAYLNGYTVTTQWDPVVGLGAPIGSSIFSVINNYIDPNAVRGIVRIKDQQTWKPLKKLYYKNSGTWSPINNAWTKTNGTWVKIYPTPIAISGLDNNSLSFSVYSERECPSKRVTITNSGDATLTLTKVLAQTSASGRAQIIINTNSWYTPALFGGGTSISIAPGGSAYFDVSVIGGPYVGNETASVLVYTNLGVLGNDIIEIPVEIETLPRFADLGVAEKSITIRYDQDRTEPTGTITIKNAGNGDLKITEISSDAYLFDAYNPTISGSSSQKITFKVNPKYAFPVVGYLNGILPVTGFVGGTFSPTISITATDVTRNEIKSLDYTTALYLIPHGTLTTTTDTVWAVPAGVGALGDPVQISATSNPGGPGGTGAPDYTITKTSVLSSFSRDVLVSEKGGAGAPGRTYTANVKLTSQQRVEVYIGSTGSPGTTTFDYRAPGGTNNIGIGFGGAGGPVQGTALTPTAAGGGGGAAATVVRFVQTSNSAPLGELVVGGGGGGGGGGNKISGLNGKEYDLAYTLPTSRNGSQAGLSAQTALTKVAGGGGGGGGSYGNATPGGGGVAGLPQFSDSDLLTGTYITRATGGYTGATSYRNLGISLVDTSVDKVAPAGARATVTITW